MFKRKNSIIALAGLVAAVSSAPVQAELYNLTAANSTALIDYNPQFSGIFTSVEPACWSAQQGCSSGAGVMDPFLRVQNAPVERGINSDLLNGDLQYDESASFTRGLPKNTISVLNGSDVPGGDPTKRYREFLLDVNESDNDPSYIMLSELKVFISNSPVASGFNGTIEQMESWAASGSQNTIKAYDLDLNNGLFKDRAILIDYGLLGSGGGRPDMTAYLPRIYDAVGDHVYFYTRFGCSTDVSSQNYDANCQAAIDAASLAGKDLDVNPEAGSEDWAVRSDYIGTEDPPTPVPAPPVVLGALAAFAHMRKIRSRIRTANASSLAQ